MPETRIQTAIDESINLAVGKNDMDDVVGIPMIPMFARAGESMPPWWSFSRDAYLRRFWKKGDHISTMVYTAQNILVNIPMYVIPKDPTITSHVEQAEAITKFLLEVSEFGELFYTAKAKFVEDYLCQDNGAFMEVIGAGDPEGPIEGLPLSVRHLDSRYCWRTGNKEYPVVYHDPLDSKAYKLHRTRVIYMSQMPSAEVEMHGVGFCAVSRAIQSSQHLYDIYIHKQEKLGSRPVSKFIVGSGFRGSHIMQAVKVANEAMNNMNLTRYSRVIGIGSDDVNAKLDTIDLNNFDPFDEETSINLGMYILSASFGVPIQEVWPTTGGRSGKSGDIQESRQRGKLPAEFHDALNKQLSQKYLPPYLEMKSDWTDDYQDERRAVNRDIRARNRERDIGTGAVTIRLSREQMVEDGEITRAQFRQAELESGRLENGNDISTLFYERAEPYDKMLDLGVEFPTAIRSNDREEMLDEIDTALARVLAALAGASSQRSRHKLSECKYALEWLKDRYEQEAVNPEMEGFQDMMLKPGQDPRDVLPNHEEKPEGVPNKPEESGNGSGNNNQQQSAQGQDSNTRTPDESREGTLVPPAKELVTKQDDVNGLIEDLRSDLKKEFQKDEPDESRLKEIVFAAFLLAFLLGSHREQSSLNDEEWADIKAQQERFSDSISTMIDRKANGVDMSPTVDRIANRASGLYWLGYLNKEAGPDEEELTWHVGPTKESCSDCSELNGVTKTRAEWRSDGRYPQGPMLECTGAKCLCSLS